MSGSPPAYIGSVEGQANGPPTSLTTRRGVVPDRFQIEAFGVIDRGHDLLVAAPTSSGKTLVAEYAVERALHDGRRAFYTTPIKALSNQKLRDLGELWGRDTVGLMTGDQVVRPDAPVVVMTTEVLRNMIYARSGALDGLGVVVLDEVHYLMDPYRGPVWEEVIVHLDPAVRLVCLSATVSNASEVRDWLTTVRGPAGHVVEHRRPVELRNRFLYGDRATGRIAVGDVLDAERRPNPRLRRLLEADATREPSGARGGRRRGRRRFYAPRRPEIVAELAAHERLPAIYFVFSRAGCDDAARACVDAGLTLGPGGTAELVDHLLADHLGRLDAETHDALELDRWRDMLVRGIAAHHAGLVPPLKEVIEHLFAAGALGVVFATETLALGVNLPARAVVIESLSKYRGDGHSPLTPAEYAQLTGRAGRRGIDDHGDAIVVWSPWVAFEQVAELAASQDFELRSAFRPTYNMAANLVATTDRAGACRVLGSSLAQFQADRLVVRLRRRHQRLSAELDELDELDDSLRASLGDRFEATIATDVPSPDADPSSGRRARETTGPRGSGEALRPGDVVSTVDGEIVAVVSVAHRGQRIRVRVVDPDGRSRRVSAEDLVVPRRAARLELPEPYAPDAGSFTAALAELLVAHLKRHGEGHRRRLAGPVRRQVRRRRTLRAELDGLDARIASSRADLVRRFDLIGAELERRGYVVDWTLTARGHVLASLFHECDLVIAECVADGCFDGLDEARLAALACCFVYQHRSPEDPPPPWFPDGLTAERFARIEVISRDVQRFERSAGLPETRSPDPGFVAVAHGWVLEVSITDILDEAGLSGGDFVRNARQLVDLLSQLGRVLEPVTAAAARRAAGRVDRSLVAATTVATTGSAAPDASPPPEDRP